jgi:glycerol-3-phosphate O-acyltransferase
MSAPRLVADAENRLARFNGDRDAILADVERRVLAGRLAAAERSPDASLEYVLNEIAFAEIKRLEATGGKQAAKQLGRWRELAGRLGRISASEHRAELEKLIAYYARDIVGNFDPRVYRFANDVMPPALSVLFAPLGLGLGHGSLAERWRMLGGLADRIRIEGAVDAARAACERGTLIVAPTHSSHMDSVLLGFALSRAGLPPVTYGAGKNLFTNPLLSFFMHNLGAYRVDRRLRFGLYKDVLKEYSTVLLERGYHSLFFPGGTRSRSNQVESHLKLGLLGTGLTAFVNNLREGATRPRVFVVPVTINYRLVLEAETLIEDYLAETGKSRYIIEDDEFTRLGRVFEFVRKTLAHEGSVVVRLGEPLDPFGNQVDAEGESVDRRGRRIDPSRLVVGRGDQVVVDPQRDAVYTRRLGDALEVAFRRETVFLETHLLARALFDGVTEAHRTTDIYRLLRLPPEQLVVAVSEVEARIDRLRQRIASTPEAGRLADEVARATAAEIVDEGVRALSTYHTSPVVGRAGDHLEITAMKLCYYYRNRTAQLPVEPMGAADAT